MPYAQLDIHFDEHPSHADLELEHFGLMACAIAHCNRLLTDGFVSDKAVRCFGFSGKGAKYAARLVEKGKWTRVDGGYEIVGYLEWNPSKAEVDAKFQRKQEAGRLAGLASGRARTKTNQLVRRSFNQNRTTLVQRKRTHLQIQIQIQIHKQRNTSNPTRLAPVTRPIPGRS
jgi:hypothetical protein